jgi:alanine racemase
MELKSAVSCIKKVKKGETVSYDRTWTAAKDTHIGIIPAGYGDGLSRSLSNNHSVLIRGKEYPVTGRVCMDQCMIDLGSAPEVKRWDEVVIFGPGFRNAADIAEKLGTIPHEITCNISKRVPR